ncbi:MAG: starch-binding protein [Muribaculaceae bacterium]|nr:starch-binding protein [Muribaculaceae bacterium]
MKTFRHILTYLQAALLIGLATACRDDLNTPSVAPDVDIDTGISIRIPNLSRAADFARSRAEDPVDNANIVADEGKVKDNDIHLFIFGDDTENIYVNLGDATEFGSAYTELPSLDKNGNKIYAGIQKTEDDEDVYYTIPMLPGTYRIYILANLKSYGKIKDGNSMVDLSSLDDDEIKAITEEQIKGMQLQFSKPLKAGELPMVCLPKDVDGTDTNGEFDILQNDLKNLKCNLRFLCSKVRYTVLFDKTTDGFSHEAYKAEGSTLDFDIDGVSVTAMPTTTNIESPSTAPTYAYIKDASNHNSTTFNLTISPADFGDNWSGVKKQGDNWTVDYPSTAEARYTPLKNHQAWTASDLQRSWQGVAYLPENLSTDDAKRTILNINGIVDGEYAASFDIPLNKGLADDTKLKRATQYDIVALAQHRGGYDITLEVAEWDRTQLVYSLEGPFFLHTETTTLPVVAGQTNKMWFDTNVNRDPAKGELEIVSPMKDGRKVYDADFIGDSIFIKVNPYFAAGSLDKTTVADDGGTITYFHIRAKNLLKRIEVTPFRHEAFFKLTPEKVEWNVGDLITSGKYTDNVDVTASTNMKITSITYEWDENTKKEFSNIPEVTLPAKTTTVDGVVNDILSYSGINDPSHMAFWKKNHTLTITYTAEAGEGEDKVVKTQSIPVTIKAYRDTYIIHAKIPSGWTSPHIYVYQCLEFPTTFNNAANQNRAGRPIASKSDGNTAALEYSFTGKLAFLGWGNGQNDQDADIAGPVNGFWYFTSGDWEPSRTNTDHYAIYDMCEEHRTSLKDSECSSCKSASYYNYSWPGIRMKEEDSGWYTFELTGIATPGKALIMFADEHSYRGDIHDPEKGGRFPGYTYIGYWNNQKQYRVDPGIPLFDYPDKEGWIDLTQSDDKKKVFSPNYRCEQQQIVVVSDTKRVWCYQDNNGWANASLYAYESKDGSSNAADWPGTKWTHYKDNWYYVEINKKFDRIIFVNEDKSWQYPATDTPGLDIGTSGDVYYEWEYETSKRPN